MFVANVSFQISDGSKRKMKQIRFKILRKIIIFVYYMAVNL